MKNFTLKYLLLICLSFVGFLTFTSVANSQTSYTLDSYVGAYSTTITYQKNNIVLYNSDVYISLVTNNLNNIPSSSASWQKIGSSLADVNSANVAITGGTISGITSLNGINSTTLGFLDATSSIQTQLNSKANSSSLAPVATSGLYSSLAGGPVLPTGTIVGTTDTQTLTAKTIDGVTPGTFVFLDATSSIQTQLNNKASLISPALTGTPTTPTAAAGTGGTQIATNAYADNSATTAASSAQSASLSKANNLLDLASATTARTNLGLGTAATTAATAYDTAGAAAAVAANTINGKPLSSNPSLNSYDVGAVAGPIGGTSVYDQGVILASFDSFNSIVPVWPAANGANIQVVFLNVSATPETPGPPMTLTAAIESPIGTRHALTVGGNSTVNVSPGALVIFDPLSIDVTKGIIFNVYTHGVRTPGNTVALPYNRTYGLISGTSLAPNTTTRAGGFYDGIELGTTRTLSDGVAIGTTTFTSATAAFGLSTSDASDAGNFLTVGGTTYTIVSVTNATTVILSGSPAAATGLTFTVAQADKTLTGTIATGNNIAPGPFAILGQVGTSIRTAGIVGDSISYGVGANLALGSWAVQALNQAGVTAGLATQVAISIPFVNASQMSETVANLSINHAARFALLGRVRYILGMLGVNDLTNNASTTTLETNMVKLWAQESLRGSKPYYGTIAPHSASSDGWLTLSNQSVLNSTNETSRIAVNNWMRDGAPISSATGLPVAIGSATATTNRCPFYIAGIAQVNSTSGVATASGPGIHPATGLFELADSVESSHNSGFWAVDAGNRTVNDAIINSGALTTLISATAAFSSGDVGHYVSIAGAGAGGATLVRDVISSVTNSTTAILTTAATTTVTGAQATIDGQLSTFMINNGDGLHPGINGHKIMGATAGLTVATWQ